MNKPMGIFLMIIFGVSGVGVTALAWFYPALNLDKFLTTLAGLIGVSFAIFQSCRFKHSYPTGAKPSPVEVATEDKP